MKCSAPTSRYKKVDEQMEWIIFHSAKLGKRQKDIAIYLGVSQATISKYIKNFRDIAL